MADVQAEAFRPTGLLHLEVSMGTDSGLPEVEDFVPNGLLGHQLADDTPSCQDTLTHFTSVAPSSPFRQNGLLDPSMSESGAYKM
jgi:hypothetical protein